MLLPSTSAYNNNYYYHHYYYHPHLTRMLGKSNDWCMYVDVWPMVGSLQMLVFFLPLLPSPPANSYMHCKAQCKWSCDSPSTLGQSYSFTHLFLTPQSDGTLGLVYSELPWTCWRYSWYQNENPCLQAIPGQPHLLFPSKAPLPWFVHLQNRCTMKCLQC